MMLWSYAPKAAEVHCNCLKLNNKGILPEEKIANIRSVRNLSDEHTWGCPVYALNCHLQDLVWLHTKVGPLLETAGHLLGPIISTCHASSLNRTSATFVGKSGKNYVPSGDLHS
eukprot:8550055-Ditylum_brightwellii.AAC.1